MALAELRLTSPHRLHLELLGLLPPALVPLLSEIRQIRIPACFTKKKSLSILVASQSPDL
ncbi:uncharacterized protein N7477_009046 [Penicillium maclennaniae]|uniref:uncharacterized protein n=1 Tax=Penicillium maclennaniae TaxID=1343394 RepID=UPI00254189AC|nr:uncharacterized protein N7477_009046 [Penicillium maclennaniae]KAJ5661430.1 hypothetical protein N7477_009046 [Penicillium maclennaniae]